MIELIIIVASFISGFVLGCVYTRWDIDRRAQRIIDTLNDDEKQNG